MSKLVDETAGPIFQTAEGSPSHFNDPIHALNGHVESKSALIARACQENDTDNLIRLATSKGGLMNDLLRRKACG
jgi:hypothetical protein